MSRPTFVPGVTVLNTSHYVLCVNVEPAWGENAAQPDFKKDNFYV